MGKRNTRGGSNLIFLTILLVVVFLVSGYLFLLAGKELSFKSWEGSWEIVYFYDNDPALLYEGTLVVKVGRSVTGYLEVIPPKSNRREKIPLQNVKLRKKALTIEGQIVHESYKVRGGFLKEKFQLQLESVNKFKGTGKCLEFCAEGTDNMSITWSGTK